MIFAITIFCVHSKRYLFVPTDGSFRFFCFIICDRSDANRRFSEVYQIGLHLDDIENDTAPASLREALVNRESTGAPFTLASLPFHSVSVWTTVQLLFSVIFISAFLCALIVLLTYSFGRSSMHSVYIVVGTSITIVRIQ